MKARFFIIPAIVLSAVACKQLEPEAPVVVPEETTEAGTWSITIQASKAVDTKALYLDTSGEKDVLNAYWLETEKVFVYSNSETYVGILDVIPDAGDKPTTATLSGTITAGTETIYMGDQIILKIPRPEWDYTGQVGTLASIQSNYDYAIAYVEVLAKDDENKTITTAAATFQNCQSIYRFSFKSGTSALSIKDLTISSAGNRIATSKDFSGFTTSWGSLTVTPAAATSDPLYVAISNGDMTDDTYNFIITGEDNALYSASKPIPARVLQADGKFISAKDITATQSDFGPSGETTTNAL